MIEMVFFGVLLGGVLVGECESFWFIGEVYLDLLDFIGLVLECLLCSVFCGIGFFFEEMFFILFINCIKELLLIFCKNFSVILFFVGIDMFIFLSLSIFFSIMFLRLRNFVVVV